MRVLAASPTFLVDKRIYTTVAFNANTSGDTIEGSSATIEGTEYISSITINATTTDKAITVGNNVVTSGESTATYVITTQHK